MMTYYYDIYGWLSETPIAGRSTEIAPPAPVDNKRPNFTGYDWVLLEYTPPPQMPVGTADYQRLRAAEYPPMEDYLDGIVKSDQAQVDKYIADCLAVKTKYPKPE